MRSGGLGINSDFISAGIVIATGAGTVGFIPKFSSISPPEVNNSIMQQGAGVAASFITVGGTLNVSSGVIALSQPSTFAQTWNAAGVTFTGLTLAMTDTASAAASKFVEYFSGAGGVTSMYDVRKDGRVTATAGYFSPSAALLEAAPYLEANDGVVTGTRIKVFRVGSSPAFILNRANTSFAAPSSIANADSFGAFNFRGYESVAADFFDGAQIGAVARENWTNTAHGTKLQFNVVAPTTTAVINAWNIQVAAATAEFVSGQATARIVGGSTNGLAIRNSANTVDRFSVNDAGTATTVINDGSRGALFETLSAASGERTTGVQYRAVGASNLTLNINGSGNAGSSLQAVYNDGTQFREAWSFTNVAAGFSTLSLMRSGGNVVIGGTAAGATASGVLAFGTINGTAPTATVDLVQLYGFDIGAGNRAFACYQEYAPYASVAAASTHKWPVTLNGVTYYVMVTTVA